VDRLALGLPTVLQIHEGYAILFHEGGTSQLSHLNHSSAYEPITPSFAYFRERIWALVDLGPLLPEPANIFKCPGTFFIVTTTSPGSGRLRWLEQVGHQYFYMKPWTLSEVLQAYVDPASRCL